MVGHAKPDGDSVASALALAAFLKRLKKQVTLLNEGPFYRREILSYQGLFSQSLPPPSEYSNSALMVVDCADRDRMGIMAPLTTHLECAVIDHHLENETEPYGTIRYVSSNAPSTTLLIQRLIEESGYKLSKREAQWILFGFLTDSGFFRHLDANGEEILAYVGRALSHNTSLRKLYHKLYGDRSLTEHHLLGHLLTSTESYLQGRLLVAYKSRAIVEQCGTPFINHGLLYNHLLATEKVEVCILISELPNKSGFDISLRSLGVVNVSKIAGEYGGGGHAAAAGFRWEGALSKLQQSLIATIGTILARSSAP